MLWFVTQEVAGEAGFEDLLALTQVKMPVTAKLEMARNYWDEMGRGRVGGMHGPLLERLAGYLNVDARPDNVVAEFASLWATQCWLWPEAGATASNRSVRWASSK